MLDMYGYPLQTKLLEGRKGSKPAKQARLKLLEGRKGSKSAKQAIFALENLELHYLKIIEQKMIKT